MGERKTRGAILLQDINDCSTVLAYAVDAGGLLDMSEGGLLRRWGLTPASTLGSSLKDWADSQRSAELPVWGPYGTAYPAALTGVTTMVAHPFTWQGVTINMISICSPRFKPSGEPGAGMFVIAYEVPNE